jgi:hypothetical protein
MFRYTRNPNYVGEIMPYSADAFLAAHWLSWVVVAYAPACALLPNTCQKDASIWRHPVWVEYKASSGLPMPWAWLAGRALRDICGHAGCFVTPPREYTHVS